METNKTFAQATFLASTLFCLAAGFFSLGWLVTIAALIPVAVNLIEAGEFATEKTETDCAVGDWSDLIAELAEPKRVGIAFPVWSGWTPVATAKVAREADPAILFEVSCTGPWGGQTRKLVPQARMAKELQFLTRGKYSNIRVTRQPVQ